MDRLEEIRIKNCAFLTHGEKDWLISEIERLRKEKEWLINRLIDKMFFDENYLEEEGKGIRIMILEFMQQALKEE